MKWPVVVEEVMTLLVADPVISGIYGTAIRENGSTKFTAPSLEWMLVADGIAEQWAPCVLQLDQWCLSSADLKRSEQRLFRLLHRELPSAFGALTMFAQYVDSETLASPDRDGYFARAVRFRFTPLQDRYEPAPTL